MIKSFFIFMCLLLVLPTRVSGNTKSATPLSQKDIQKVSIYFKDLGRKRHKPKLATKVVRIFDKLGREFKNENKLVKLQISINKKPFNFKRCNIDFNEYSSIVSQYHLLQVLRFCHTKLLLKKNENELDLSEKSFIEKYYEALVKSNNVGLIQLKRTRSVYPKILANVISLNNFDIDDITTLFQRTYVGKHIHYGKILTEHLQNIGLFPAKESKLFRKEFRILVANFLKNKNNEEQKPILEQILSFYSENKLLIGHKYSNKKFRQISRTLITVRKHKEARRFISRAIETQSDKHRSDLYFERIYIDLVQNDYTSALKYINRSGILGSESGFSSKLRFWVAKVFFNKGEKSLADFLFKAQISKNPLNYYSVLSAAHLKKHGHEKFLEESYLYKGQNKLSIFKKNETPVNLEFSRLRLWMQTQSEKMARLEIKKIIKGSGPSDQNRSLASVKSNLKTSIGILKLFQDEDDYLRSFKFFSRNKLINSFDFLPIATKILFPTPFLKEIKKNAKGIDPILILSLIRQESAFNPSAISSVGARGLMQLMPATARMYRKRLRKSELYKPKLNLSLGTKYLSRLYSKYNKSLIHTLSAYNAGETNVRRWQKKYFTMNDDLLKVESIPFAETEGYVKYITRNMFFYKIIFGKPLLSGMDWINDSV